MPRLLEHIYETTSTDFSNETWDFSDIPEAISKNRNLRIVHSFTRKVADYIAAQYDQNSGIASNVFTRFGCIYYFRALLH